MLIIKQKFFFHSTGSTLIKMWAKWKVTLFIYYTNIVRKVIKWWQKWLKFLWWEPWQYNRVWLLYRVLLSKASLHHHHEWSVCGFGKKGQGSSQRREKALFWPRRAVRWRRHEFYAQVQRMNCFQKERTAKGSDASDRRIITNKPSHT